MTTTTIAITVARSAIFVFWEQAEFDSDQAVIGLMAKHLSEGRAFPMFLYGLTTSSPSKLDGGARVIVAGASVAALKLPLLAINIAVALLLIHLLERDAGLRPGWRRGGRFFVLPPPGTAAELVNAAGVNLEPFLYVLLIWMTRNRPAWCGLIVGIGFLQRELTIYAPIALADRRCRRRVVDARRLAAGPVGARVAAEVWLVVAVRKTFSSAAGPGTSIADVPASNNVGNLLERVCFDRGGGGVGSLVTAFTGRSCLARVSNR